MAVSLWAMERSILTAGSNPYIKDWALANVSIRLRVLFKFKSAVFARRLRFLPVLVSVLFTGGLRVGGSQEHRSWSPLLMAQW
jgi:hypothetical protein